MKIMITGANGTIGADLVNFFSKNHKIYAFYRTPNLATRKLKNKNIKWIKQDLSKKISKKINPNIVIHCVVTHPFARKNSYKDYISSNIISLKNVLEFAREKNINKFFYLSSFKIYGSVDRNKLDDNDIFINPDILGATKILSERIIELQKFNYLIIRLPGVVSYNIKDQRRPWINNIIYKLKLNSKIEIYNQKKLFNNIIDTFEIYRFIKLLISKKNLKKGTLNLAASKPVKIKKMIIKLKNSLISKSKIIFTRKLSQHYIVNSQKARRVYKFNISSTDLILNRYINNPEGFLF